VSQASRRIVSGERERESSKQIHHDGDAYKYLTLYAKAWSQKAGAARNARDLITIYEEEVEGPSKENRRSQLADDFRRRGRQTAAADDIQPPGRTAKQHELP